MSKITVLRHSHWDYRPNGRDAGINATGREESIKAAKTLGPFDLVYASQYRRAQETASILRGTANVLSHPTLNELEFPGEFPTTTEYTQFVFENHLSEAAERAAALARLIQGLSDHKSIVMVSHRVMMIALYAFVYHGGIQPDDHFLIDFKPLWGFELNLPDRDITLVRMIRP